MLLNWIFFLIHKTCIIFATLFTHWTQITINTHNLEMKRKRDANYDIRIATFTKIRENDNVWLNIKWSYFQHSP